MASRASSIFARNAVRCAPAFSQTVSRPPAVLAARHIHTASPLGRDKSASHSQTDSDIEVKYPDEQDLPKSKPIAGAGGQYVKPTLTSFTLDGNVGIVTGGARGLGLVIGQGMVFSGSNLALVDMNRKFLLASIRREAAAKNKTDECSVA